MKAGETIISARNFDTEDCDVLLRRSLTGTTKLFENHDRYQFIGYSQLNQYLFVCLKQFKKQIDAGCSVISTEHIKYERVCIIMKMVQ